MKLSIVIPCYNESATIASVLEKVVIASLPNGWTRELIVVDDGSRDGTADAVESARASLVDRGLTSATAITLYRQPKNGGKGSAIKAGFSRATGDFILIQDADAEYDPNDYTALLQPIVDGRAQIVFGSRILQKNNVPFSSVYFYGGLLVAHVFNFFFRTRLSDITTCYKVFPQRLVPTIVCWPSNDFVFDAVELTYALASSGSIVEVPIHYHARTKQEGKKLNWRHGLRSVMMIIKIAFGFRPA